MVKRSLNATSQQPLGCVSKQVKPSGVEDPVKVFVGSIPAGRRLSFLQFCTPQLSDRIRPHRWLLCSLSFSYESVRLVVITMIVYLNNREYRDRWNDDGCEV